MKQITPGKRRSSTGVHRAALSTCWVLAVHTSVCTAPDDNNLGKRWSGTEEGISKKGSNNKGGTEKKMKH